MTTEYRGGGAAVLSPAPAPLLLMSAPVAFILGVLVGCALTWLVFAWLAVLLDPDRNPPKD